VIRIEKHLYQAWLQALVPEDHVEHLAPLLFGEQAEAAVFLRVGPVITGLRT
jgi:hypothetical protein